MKINLLLTMAILVMIHGWIIGQPIQTPNGFQLRTGINVAQWLSQTDIRGTEREQYIVQADIDTIVSMGFDHIRLPVDEVQLWADNGRKYEDAFQLMHNAIRWAVAKNLRVIVDLHIIRSHYFNAEIKPLWTDPHEQEKLVQLWTELSAELKQYPNNYVAYELLNEAVADDHNNWNKLIARLHSAIRQSEPERTLVIGSNRWQGVETFPFLKVPQNDKNIILSFHYYKPFALTHYKTSWTDLKEYNGPVYYPGDVLPLKELEGYPSDIRARLTWVLGNYNKQVLQKDIEVALKVAEQLELPLFCGEYGVYPTAPRDAALRWYQDLTDICRENHIAFCHWAYKGDFPVVDEHSSPLRPLVDILAK